MSDSGAKRAKVLKPVKGNIGPAATVTTTTTILAVATGPKAGTISTDDALINIPPVKKKKERHVKTDADIAAKLERKRLRKEAEQVKQEARLAKKGLATQKAVIQNKTPKWKQFLKNTTGADNSEQLKDTSFKVKGDADSSEDDDSSDSDSDNDKEKKSKISKTTGKRKADDRSETSLAYLVEWKRSRTTWRFQKLRQNWLLNHIYDDKLIPNSHWDVFLEYIHDMKGGARTAVVQDAKKIVEAPEPEEGEEEASKEKAEDENEDQEMKDSGAEGAEEKIAEEAVKQAAKVKASRALDVLRVLA
ncbi:hypothetical protein BGZ65_010254, partial [Modicella reniformis]